MELHWETVYDEPGNKLDVAVLAPGIWLTLQKKFNEYNKDYYCQLKICHLTNAEIILWASSKDKEKYEKDILECKKYANVIAGSFLGQQHLYRDYPKNL